MPFSPKVQEDALVACGRFCCICHRFAGTKIEIHHIIQKADGGSDDFDNAIPYVSNVTQTWERRMLIIREGRLILHPN